MRRSHLDFARILILSLFVAALAAGSRVAQGSGTGESISSHSTFEQVCGQFARQAPDDTVFLVARSDLSFRAERLASTDPNIARSLVELSTQGALGCVIALRDVNGTLEVFLVIDEKRSGVSVGNQ
jgi:hypothetical protein